MLKKIILLLLASTLSLAVYASEKYFLIVPHCLIKKASSPLPYQTLSTTPALAFIATSQDGLNTLMTAKHIRSISNCGGFIDVTEEWLEQHQSATSFLKTQERNSQQSTQKLAAADYTIQHPDQVNQLINLINPQEIWTDLITFTDPNQFPDRYSNSSNGAKAAVWLQNKIVNMMNTYHRDDVTIYTVATGRRYKQPSLVIKIGTSNAPGIVIGAHMDTYQATLKSVRPGADDDGSGSMGVLSITRTLLASGMHFKKPIYIVWYAAEEVGLLGSKFVVQDFKRKNIPIEAVLQFDMTGYAYQNGRTIWLIQDYVDLTLTNFLAQLIETYVKVPIGSPTQCNYACSDHASWKNAGIPSAFPFEAPFGDENPYIHQSTDTIHRLSLTHMTDFVKLGLAFAAELAEPM